MNLAGIGEEILVQEITIAATAESIFTALTTPEELLQWWRCEGKFQLLDAECDLRVGGKWKMRVTSCRTGQVVTVSGEYRRITRPSLLEYTWIREEDGARTLVRWDLDERSGETKVSVSHSGLTTPDLRARNGGWPLIAVLLQKYVENQISNQSRSKKDGDETTRNLA